MDVFLFPSLSQISAKRDLICGWTESSRYPLTVNNNVVPFNRTDNRASKINVKQSQSHREA